MWAPVWLVTEGRRNASASAWPKGNAAMLLGAECLVVVIASKPGAGVHHLMPFLPLHAHLFQRAHADTLATPPHSKAIQTGAVLVLAVTVAGMTWPTAQAYGQQLSFNLQLPEQILQRDELLTLAAQFPKGNLGVANDESYELTNFRPWLTRNRILQTDYGAFMDLQLSGVGDAPLQTAFARCAIPFVYMPKPGAPYTVNSRYGNWPLFSAAVRREFAHNYALIATGTYFNVFSCKTSGTSSTGVLTSNAATPGHHAKRTSP
jgi:hypothetical protein